MRTLILFRHSKAAAAEPSQSDEARPLTGRGRREAGEAGAALMAQFAPGAALVSTSTRTRETVAEAFKDFGIAIGFDDGLYLADPRALWRAFAALEAQSIVLVAHNPGLAELAAHLIETAHDRSPSARAVAENFPTSAWAAFEVSGDSYNAPGARLLDAWRPKRD